MENCLLITSSSILNLFLHHDLIENTFSKELMTGIHNYIYH